MKSPLARLFDEIGGKVIRQMLKENQRKNLPPEVQAWEEELRRQKFVQKVNYYNHLAFFYFLYLNRLKVFLTSTVILDYLIFLIPHYAFLNNLTEKIDLTEVFKWSTYFLVFLMTWEVCAKFSKPSKRNLISAKGLLVIILILFLAATSIQIIMLAETNYPIAKIVLQILFVIFACTPVILNIIKASKNKHRPNLNNIITIINYILPIIILRVVHLVGTISIFLMKKNYWEYTLFSLILLIVLIQKRPLVERLVAPRKSSR